MYLFLIVKMVSYMSFNKTDNFTCMCNNVLTAFFTSRFHTMLLYFENSSKTEKLTEVRIKILKIKE